jgi:tetratricopeptide (TPR) repeat protein
MLHKRAHLVVLGTFRSENIESVADLRKSLARFGDMNEIKLEGLSAPAVLEIMKHCLGEIPGTELLADKLYAATGGSPFFLMETLRALFEEDILPSDLQSMIELPLPESVRETIRSRLKNLSPQARQVCEAGSVLGQPCSIELLRRTSGRSLGENIEGLEELLSRQVLIDKNGTYTFIHDLTRRTIYEDLSHPRRQLLHKRAGLAYEKTNPASAPRIAYHYETGADWGKALLFHEVAASHAQEIFAWEEARYHQGKILELLAILDPEYKDIKGLLQRSQVLADRAHSYFIQGRLDDRNADLDELARLAASSFNDQLRLEAIVQRVRYLNMDGDYEKSISASSEGLLLIDKSHYIKKSLQSTGYIQARLLAQVGFSNYFLGRPEEALEALEKAKITSGEDAGFEMRGRIQHLLGYVHFHLSEYPSALVCQIEAYKCFKQVQEHNRTAWAGQDVGFMYLKLGDYQKSKQYLDESLELAQRIGALPALAFAMTHLADWHHFQGDYVKAIETYQKAAAIHSKVNSIYGLATNGIGQGLSFYHLGDYAKARRCLQQALERADSVNNCRQTARALIVLGLLEISYGAPENAYSHICSGIQKAADCDCPEVLSAGLIARASLERQEGCFDKSLVSITKAKQVISSLDLPVLNMWSAMEEGLLYLFKGRLDDADRYTQKGVNLIEKANESWIPREMVCLARACLFKKQNLREPFKLYSEKAWSIINHKAERIPADGQRIRYLERSAKTIKANDLSENVI